MARLPRDTRLAILAFALLMLLLAVASWFGYQDWQTEIP